MAPPEQPTDASRQAVPAAHLAPDLGVGLEPDLDDILDHVAAGLRSRGERMTEPRRAVVAALAGSSRAGQEHLSADEVLAGAEQAYPGVNRSTIYRALETLADLGVVQHIHSGRSATLYHLTVDGGRHAHATCDGCGAVIDLPADALRPVAERLAREHGFALDPGHVALAGRCADCVKNDAAADRG